MKRIIIFTLLTLFSFQLFSQSMTGKELLEKSIQYHDPKGKWDKAKIALTLKQDSPDRPQRLTTFKVNNRKGTFWQQDVKGGNRVIRSLKNDECTHELNGKKTFSAEEIKEHRLECKWTKFWRNYQTYLYGLPMKLKDPGTVIHEKIEQSRFQQKECWQLKVTYDEAVGKDIWYFYFHPKTYALIGYKFYHDESKNDGEYITLEDEIEVNGMKFPRDRKWYFNIDDKFLGTDYILSGK